MIKSINCDKLYRPIGPYSHSVLSNGFLYISGQIGIDKNGNLVADILKETNQIMYNISCILENVNMNFSNIVKISIFLKNIKDFDIVNKTYMNYFNNNFPARETLEVSALPLNANIEISAIASI
ncbi:MAG: RidA family protein [Bacteroides sp.]|nr:MAG: RidA family protein [Bacteroides sp.]